MSGFRGRAVVEPHPQGCLLHVRVKPGARRQQVLGVRDGLLHVAVHAPPEKGKANQALVALLADVLGARRGQLRVLSGETSRQKQVLLEGGQLQRVVDRLAALESESHRPTPEV